MTNKFSKAEARVLVYDRKWNYLVVNCNNWEDYAETIAYFGKPTVYMTNFNSWQEVAIAKKCYEWQMSALPIAKQNVEEPTDEEDEWFWQKQLEDEFPTWNVAEVVAKWDDMLPETPDKYKPKKVWEL